MISQIQSNNLAFSSKQIDLTVKKTNPYNLKRMFAVSNATNFDSVSFSGSVKVHKLLPVLKKLGFEKVRQNGSHLFLANLDGRTTTIPIHGKGEIPEGLLNAIIKEIGMTKKDFFKYL